jgi:hypothetical protein
MQDFPDLARAVRRRRALVGGAEGDRGQHKEKSKAADREGKSHLQIYPSIQRAIGEHVNRASAKEALA